MRQYVVPASTDDGFNYEDTPNDSHLTSVTVRFGHRSGGGRGDCTGGFRFLPTLPKSLTIIQAKLLMVSFGTGALAGTLRTKIAADNVDNSPTFNDADKEPRDRVLTAPKVDWDEAAWPASTSKFSPDIKAVIQEIYDRAGFNPGNGLSIIIINDGSDADANANVYSEDGIGSAARLRLWTNETETDETYATRMPHQKACFYANGRFWIFYCSSNTIYYRTSIDGVNWSVEEGIGAAPGGASFSIWFDGTYIHYARTPASEGAFYYRRGTPNAGGTITWSAAEQAVGTTGLDPTIVIDDQGYPWIFHLKVFPAFEPWVIKSDTNDGTWSTQAGFPFQLSADANNSLRCFGIPLTGGKVFAIWGWGNAQAKGRCWTGAAWDAEEPITVGNLFNYASLGPGMSAVNEGDDVHLVSWDTTPDLKYRKRTYGVGWGAEETIQAAVSGTSEPVVSRSGATLYCFWAGSPAANHIYYKKRTAPGWDALPTDWINEAVDGLTANDRLSCSYIDYGNYIILMYMALVASPHQVRVNNISTLAPPAGAGSSMAARMMAAGVL